MIEIEWLSDSYWCETCGSSWSDGAIVKKDGEVILELEPLAHCYEPQHWERDEVYRMIIQKLGHEVKDV